MSDARVADQIEAAARTMDVFERVHEELDAGKRWEEIDNGFTKEAKNVSYTSWYAYMQQHLLNQLRSVILTHRAAALSPSREDENGR